MDIGPERLPPVSGEAPGGALLTRAAALRWAALALATGLAVLVLMGFADLPVARFLHGHPALSWHGHRLMEIPVAVLGLTSCAFVLGGIARLGGGARAGFWRLALFAGLACATALLLKTEAKFLFGRLSPSHGGWALDSAFAAFHPLHRIGSFPSGHMTVMGSVAPFLWRRGWSRALWLLLTLAAAWALAAAGAHYLSDLTAGLFLGASVGTCFLLAACRHRGSRSAG